MKRVISTLISDHSSGSHKPISLDSLSVPILLHFPILRKPALALNMVGRDSSTSNDFTPSSSGRIKTRDEATNEINAVIAEYESCDLVDRDLWEGFKEDFGQWTEEDLSNQLLRKLRVLLRKRGVWMSRDSDKTIARSLVDLLAEEAPSRWTGEEITNSDEDFVSPKIKKLIRTDFGRNFQSHSPAETAQSQPQSIYTEPHQQHQNPQAPSPQNPTERRPFEPITQYTPFEQRPFAPPPANVPSVNIPPPASFNQRSFAPSQPLSQPPPFQQYQPPQQFNQAPTQGYGRDLAKMAKLYTEEAKYGGEEDSFDFKLSIFHDIYSRADVPPEAEMKAFPTMLKGLALDY